MPDQPQQPQHPLPTPLTFPTAQTQGDALQLASALGRSPVAVVYRVTGTAEAVAPAPPRARLGGSGRDVWKACIIVYAAAGR